MLQELTFGPGLRHGKVVIVHIEGYAAVTVAAVNMRVCRQRDHTLHLYGVTAVLNGPGDGARFPTLDLLVRRQLFVPHGNIMGINGCVHPPLAVWEPDIGNINLPALDGAVAQRMAVCIVAGNEVSTNGVSPANQHHIPMAAPVPHTLPVMELRIVLHRLALAEQLLPAKADVEDTFSLLPFETLQAALQVMQAVFHEVDVLLQLSSTGIEVQVLEQVLIFIFIRGSLTVDAAHGKGQALLRDLLGNEFAKRILEGRYDAAILAGPVPGRQRRFCACDPVQLDLLSVDLFSDPDGLLLLSLNIESQRFFGRIHNTLCSPLQAGDKVVGQPSLLILAMQAFSGVWVRML